MIIYGRAVGGGASTKVPSIFGDGSDGDLVVTSGQTYTEEVITPHYQIVEKNFNSINIEAGGIYTASACNAGLVLRCKGDCTINGTIDQSGKAPKTNPNNSYEYPSDLVCGDGGSGGKGGQHTNNSLTSTPGNGGAGMPARPYGGGYSGGSGGGAVNVVGSSVGIGYNGGSAEGITVEIDDSLIFQPGVAGKAGQYGSGGGAGSANGCQGVPGTYGGGVVLLYVGGNLVINGTINCNGLDGNNGIGTSGYGGQSGGSGGGGGGAIYIIYNGTILNAGALTVSGGQAGSGLPYTTIFQSEGWPTKTNASSSGTAGGIGTITIKKYGEAA